VTGAAGVTGPTGAAGATGATGATGAAPALVGCSVFRTTTTSIANQGAVVPFDNEAFDTDGFHDNSTNPSRITIPAGLGGKYLFTATLRWANNSSGIRIAYFRINGSGAAADTRAQQFTPLSSGDASHVISDVLDLAAGDYVELFGYQNSGGGLNVGVSAVLPRFGCVRQGT
jgi:hypothetical protein